MVIEHSANARTAFDELANKRRKSFLPLASRGHSRHERAPLPNYRQPSANGPRAHQGLGMRYDRSIGNDTSS